MSATTVFWIFFLHMCSKAIYKFHFLLHWWTLFSHCGSGICHNRTFAHCWTQQQPHLLSASFHNNLVIQRHFVYRRLPIVILCWLLSDNYFFADDLRITFTPVSTAQPTASECWKRMQKIKSSKEHTRSKVDHRVHGSHSHRAVVHTSCSRSALDATPCPSPSHISASHQTTQRSTTTNTM